VSEYILDNAVTMAWCFSDEATTYTENLLERLSNLADIAVVPALWLYEVTNVSMLAARKGRSRREAPGEMFCGSCQFNGATPAYCIRCSLT
jgi:hypothetical protein